MTYGLRVAFETEAHDGMTDVQSYTKETLELTLGDDWFSKVKFRDEQIWRDIIGPKVRLTDIFVAVYKGDDNSNQEWVFDAKLDALFDIQEIVDLANIALKSQ
jgi:hypothetical protein